MDVLKVLGSQPLYQLLVKWARSWRAHDDFWQSLCVLAAMSIAMGVCGLWGQMARCIPLFLGIIACGLSERDERPHQRIISLLLTLLSFATAALAIELLMPHPWLFVIGLGASTFTITLFGGVGGRFNTMMSAMLVLALYSMITIDQRQEGLVVPFWRDGALLLAGALGYGLLSLGVLVIAHHRHLPRHLSLLYTQLGRYMMLRSEQFVPVKGQNVRQRERQLAKLHGVLVQSFALSYDSVMQTLATSRNSVRAARDKLLLERAERLFERASSSHHSHDVLVNAFYHSDVLFRCQRLMKLQGEVCCSLATMLHEPAHARIASDERTRANQDLLDAWYYLDSTSGAITSASRVTDPASVTIDHYSGSTDSVSDRHEVSQPRKGAYQVLQRLIDNLCALERELEQLSEVAREAREAPPHSVLDVASAPRVLWRRFWLLLTPHNPTFRHAVRLSCALMTGYILIQLLDPSQGYWIMLTTVFVCRPSFGATHKALRQRIMGTLAGLFMGWAMLRLFPIPELQAGMAVVAGVLFFLLRQKHYALATCAITLMVLCCFNQVGNSFTLIWPRLLDTLLGTLIASAAVCFILSDWKGARLEPKVSAALVNMARYLTILIEQYSQGRQETSELLTARQDARQSDAALVSLLSNLDQVPYRSVSILTVAGYQLHGQLHALLGYLTALRVHRPEGVLPQALILTVSAWHIAEALTLMADYVTGKVTDAAVVQQGVRAVQHSAERISHDQNEDAQRFAYDQLEAMMYHLEPLQDAVLKMRALLMENGNK